MEFIKGVRKVFSEYKALAEKSMRQVDESQLFVKPHDHCNTIAVIIKHMAGNMISRWTDFLTTDGEKPWRQRDEEFTDEILSKEQLMEKWEEGWACLFNALDALEEKDLDRTVYIRNEPLTVLAAITRQLAHYSYHVGQIVFAAKGSVAKWESLSIPKGASGQYNADKFAKGRS